MSYNNRRYYRTTDTAAVVGGCLLAVIVMLGIDLLIAWGVQTIANEGFGLGWSYWLAFLFTVVVSFLLGGLRSSSS
jgi:cobalamin biosynthesis protein CobD/CbiB